MKTCFTSIIFSLLLLSAHGKNLRQLQSKNGNNRNNGRPGNSVNQNNNGPNMNQQFGQNTQFGNNNGPNGNQQQNNNLFNQNGNQNNQFGNNFMEIK